MLVYEGNSKGSSIFCDVTSNISTTNSLCHMTQKSVKSISYRFQKCKQEPEGLLKI